MDISFDVSSLREPELFNIWRMSPRTVLDMSSDGFYIHLNRIPLTVYEKRLTNE